MSFIHTFEIKENSAERNNQQNSIHIVDTQELFAVNNNNNDNEKTYNFSSKTYSTVT